MSYEQNDYNILRKKWLYTNDTREGLDLLEQMSEMRESNPEIKHVIF